MFLSPESLRGKSLGIPQKLPPFNPDSDIPKPPDYENPGCWVKLPEYFIRKKQPVDVFWVYPTILSDDKTYLMDISDPDLRKKAEWTIVEQASIFDGQANIYAPYYRQNNVKINPLMLTDAKAIFNLGQDDLIRAFDYFLRNFNRGERPVILAAHSQGSVRVVELSKAGELLAGDAESLKRLVCAYTIGYSITPLDLKVNPLIRISEGRDDTGCFVLYNTISDEEGKEKEGPTIIPGTFVVNPLNWKTDDTFAPASMNLGACFFKHEHQKTPDRYSGFAAAQIAGSALVITDIKNPEELPATSVTFPKGVYHMYDYAIFYENLRKNVADRISAYMEKNSEKISELS
ncbi:hypothetical protein J2128_001158 [Methanomicrobium sp. W14]|uniref:DUF3089 domain-containing protein n=1 Tax=Methanomicrobium sp. W14 TaxID=2817839 RepID=UPI001AE460BF|nr:DUF3089 domain-containing protein [Methanomicrobium sp. W14]MBP2133237.1 hypothetical protein [Methanomicrobium sp. W14]